MKINKTPAGLSDMNVTKSGIGMASGVTKEIVAQTVTDDEGNSVGALLTSDLEGGRVEIEVDNNGVPSFVEYDGDGVEASRIPAVEDSSDDEDQEPLPDMAASFV